MTPLATDTVSPNLTRVAFEAQRQGYLRGLADQAGGRGEVRKLRSVNQKLSTRNTFLGSQNKEQREEIKRLKMQLALQTDVQALVANLAQQAGLNIPTAAQQAQITAPAAALTTG